MEDVRLPQEPSAPGKIAPEAAGGNSARPGLPFPRILGKNAESAQEAASLLNVPITACGVADSRSFTFVFHLFAALQGLQALQLRQGPRRMATRFLHLTNVERSFNSLAVLEL
jgi:hypothetical protein